MVFNNSFLKFDKRVGVFWSVMIAGSKLFQVTFISKGKEKIERKAVMRDQILVFNNSSLKFHIE